jgi:Uma2 family endonuclease
MNLIGVGDPLIMVMPRTSTARQRALTTSTRTPPSPLAGSATIGDLLRRLGNISAGRVRLHPFPGTASERDVLRILDDENRPCELVEGTLVEKPMGYEESELAMLIGTLLNNYVRPRRLGIVTGPDGTLQLFPGLVRIPDVAFASWDRFPGRTRPKVRIPHLAPDLVVEVLSRGNTRAEMIRKLGEYFEAGVRLVWLVDHRKRTVRVHTAIDRSVLFKDDQVLDGGAVLPGFVLRLNELFARDRR